MNKYELHKVKSGYYIQADSLTSDTCGTLVHIVKTTNELDEDQMLPIVYKDVNIEDMILNYNEGWLIDFASPHMLVIKYEDYIEVLQKFFDECKLTVKDKKEVRNTLIENQLDQI